MADLNPIEILITAKDQASAVIKSAATAATQSAAEVNKANAALTKVGNSLESVGSSMTRNVTLPMVALGAVSGKMAYDFANKMELLHTNAGVAQDAIAGLSDQVLQMAGETGQAPDKLAEGLYHVASAGNGIWSTSQQMDILRVAAEGANLGMANLDDTTYSLTSAMASGVKGVQNATEMMATLNAIVGAGDMKMQDLNGALSTGILSTAATFGISIQSVGSALATLTDNGEHADEAATRLRMTIALMSSPSSMAAKQLGALGLTAEDAKHATEGMNAVFAKSGLTTTKLADDLRQPNGIAVAIQDLKKHLEDAGLSASETDAMLSKAFGGGRTDAALLTMLQNTDRLDAKYQSITHDAGQFQNKLNDLNNTPNQKLRDAWASMQASLIKIGNDLLPLAAQGLQWVASAVSNVADWWHRLDPISKGVLEAIAIALGVGGPILVGLGKFIGLIGDLRVAFGFLQLVGSGALTALGAGFNALTTVAIPAVQGAFSGLSALIASPLIMPAIAVGAALAALALVQNAANQARAAIDGAMSATQQEGDESVALIKNARQQYNDGKISAARLQQLLAIYSKPTNQQALGTNFAPGGRTLVGENGPEIVDLPTGSKVYNARESQQMMSGGKGVTINMGGVTIANQMDEQRFLANLGWRLALR